MSSFRFRELNTMVLDRLRGETGVSEEDKLLYLISDASTDGVLRGRKKLTKLAFFAEYWSPEEDLLLPSEQFGGFNFIIYKFGPFSKGLFKSFDELKDDGLVEEVRRPRGNSEITVTEEGERRVEIVESQLRREERSQVAAVRNEWADRPGHELEELSLDYLGIDESETQEYMGMPVSVVISERS